MISINYEINDQTLTFHKYGGIFINSLKLLVISDLHLGKGFSFIKKGFNVPPYDIDDTIDKLEEIINLFRPNRVIALGDNVHEFNSLENINHKILSRINILVKKYNFIWILGNHDKSLININHLEGNFIDTYSEKDFFFTHIKNDSNKKNLFELSGHYHPKYALKVNKLSYYYKCFVLGKRFCILPSFGTYTGGLNVKSREFMKGLKEKNTKLIIIGNSKFIIERL
jgi:DNA ligase-associated metallophosphoesterase